MIELAQKLSINEQLRLLEESRKKDIHLSDLLIQKGLSYDNLRYRNYVNGFKLEERNRSIEDLKNHESQIPAVSFFTGAGGMDLGFEYAGFKTIASVENTELFCNTLRLNNPDRPVIGPPNFKGDISNKEEIAEQLKSIVGLKENFDGVFHGGPPCQPFSIASNQRFKKGDENFKRLGFDDMEKGNLLFDFVWLIQQFKPKAFVIENVPGLKDLDDGKQLAEAIKKLTKSGYKVVNPRVLNASYFGVPQNRNRIFVVGTLSKKEFNYPLSSIFQTPCIDVFNSDFNLLQNHETRKHTASSVLRYMELDYGGRDKLGRVDRLNPFLPSKTVIAGGTKGGGRSHLHPFSPRTLSVRESAKIQTFPDDYIFTGSTARQFTQVGNAVPPKLAFAIAQEIKKIL
ncbi:DNA cytosine methyltransferase [Psychroflexus montanilacus]|uniref:DNA cytosine methyltransferase n=1 Tax=Psychroflexus montanilacus TaxID=2873598 RepID=UPI001CCC3900|nr:DNA cytosine methyltransferase [Psychroflexus montanilacus]MBZ9652856.1 DNA cytosine methyltransferase [Psychroflexus montanilacus]